MAGNKLEGDAPDELLRDGITMYVYFWSSQIVFEIAFLEEYESKFCVALHLHFDVNSLVDAEIFHITISSGRVLKVVLVGQTCEDIVTFLVDVIGIDNLSGFSCFRNLNLNLFQSTSKKKS